VYREKSALINEKLAECYEKHPALLLWHISNEYGGECHCELCQAAFREWLKMRYRNDLDALNRAYWSRFWSHTYTEWEQLHSPVPHGEHQLHGLNLDWRRFVTHQTTDFMKHEIASVRKHSKDVPVTANFMSCFYDLDYWKMAPHLDIVSWDSYPQWHRPGGTIDEPAFQAFTHDMMRSLKGGQSFLLMECSPSVSNWQAVTRQKRHGLHLAASLQAIAHGSDSVQYFQWRSSRGSCEKYHGAVLEHSCRTDAKTFQDVAQTGRALQLLSDVPGSRLKAEVAIIFDWESRWALDDSIGFKQEKGYLDTVFAHYKGFWKQGIVADVIDSEQDLSGYKIVVAPMLYMVREGVADSLKAFTRSGGTLILTYFSGMVNETDLCFLGGFPGPLKELCGIWAEEIDSMGEETFAIRISPGSGAHMPAASYLVHDFCTRIHLEGAECHAVYEHDLYGGTPALTRNAFGNGEAWYMGARTGQDFLDTFYAGLAAKAGLAKPLQTALPVGLSVTERVLGKKRFLFVLNFSGEKHCLKDPRLTGHELLTGSDLTGSIQIPEFGGAVVVSET
jgi:beta-galactosidase